MATRDGRGLNATQPGWKFLKTFSIIVIIITY